MNKKIFLTSAVIMCMACPAMAETFPQDGNMLENKTYTEAAVYDNTGIYEGTVVANADYSTNYYNVSAGSYFTGLNNDNTATTATCTSGNYCPGVASTTYDNNAFGDTGLQTCPSGYASSDLGASADTQCYRTCDIANMGENGTIAAIAHAATLSGNDYYGNGADTCEPATCVSGWHVKPGTPDLMTLISTGEQIGTAFNANNPNAPNYNETTYKLTQNGEFVVDYGNNGMVHGYSICSTQNGSRGTMSNGTYPDITTFDSLTDEWQQEDARYCYCNLDSYIPKGGSAIALSGVWVFYKESSKADCSTYCAHSCQGIFRNDADAERLALRATMLDFIQSSPATCEANTINITWNDASAEDIAATGAATTVYEGDIKTPLKAITKPGKTFVGWKFVKPTNPAPVQGEGD